MALEAGGHLSADAVAGELARAFEHRAVHLAHTPAADVLTFHQPLHLVSDGGARVTVFEGVEARATLLVPLVFRGAAVGILGARAAGRNPPGHGQLKMILSTARRTDDQAKVGRILDQAIEQLTVGIASLRQLITDLRPPVLDEAGVQPALEHLVQRLGLISDLNVRMNVDLAYESGGRSGVAHQCREARSSEDCRRLDRRDRGADRHQDRR